jgi:tetratricopeptide (TPR) repeat protein
MNGDIAAARAYLKAGNSNRALELVEQVLKLDPYSNQALEAHCNILFTINAFDKLQSVAASWLSREPGNIVPSFHLLLCHIHRKDKRAARVTIDNFRIATPNPEEVDLVESIYEAKFGNTTEGFSTLAKSFGEAGDKGVEHQFKSYAALANADIRGAIQQAELGRQAGDCSASTLARLSMLYFRALRFGKSRECARLALKIDPTLPIPRELLILSWVVLFPPFLIGHLALTLTTNTRHWTSMFGNRAFFYALGVPVVVLVLVLLDKSLGAIGVPVSKLALLSIAFILYSPFIGSVTKLVYGWRKSTVKLNDY